MVSIESKKGNKGKNWLRIVAIAFVFGMSLGALIQSAANTFDLGSSMLSLSSGCENYIWPAYNEDMTSLYIAANSKDYTEENSNDPAYNDSGYIAASSEDFVFRNADALGYNTTGNKNSAGCLIWNESSATNPTVYADLMQHKKDMIEYNRLISEFTSDVVDLRLHLGKDPSDAYNICKSVDLHPDGIKGIFRSRGLSYTPSGFVEPLLPPMRNPDVCDLSVQVLDLTYLVHDFGAMCRKLKPTSRIVLFDIGASLEFGGSASPALYLMHLYHKFGFPFDHIYAYEVTPTNPKKVFSAVPRTFLPAYHWINVGVSTVPGSPLNPFTTLLDKYNEDDLVIVKLDIDTPTLELPLALQLLKDKRFGKLVDQFYFEHHVHLAELAIEWGGMEGSVKDSLDLFHRLREKGIPAHFWV
jgi:hypothetical protein